MPLLAFSTPDMAADPLLSHPGHSCVSYTPSMTHLGVSDASESTLPPQTTASCICWCDAPSLWHAFNQVFPDLQPWTTVFLTVCTHQREGQMPFVKMSGLVVFLSHSRLPSGLNLRQIFWPTRLIAQALRWLAAFPLKATFATFSSVITHNHQIES